MKILKRALIIFFSIILAIFLLLLLTSLLFKGQLLEIAKNELNNMLNAEVEFSDLNLSFIRNFPNAYLALEDLSVKGIDDFEGQTLAAFKTLSITVDILSVIRMDNIQVKSVILEEAIVNAHILEDGRANWDIMKPSEAADPVSAPASVPTEAQPAPAPTFRIALNRFEIRDASLGFRDDSSNMTAEANYLNFFLSGDMSLDNADLKLSLDIAEVNFWMGGVRLLNRAHVGLASEIAADMTNMFFTLKDTQFNLNEIVLKLAGSVGMPPESITNDINIDLAFATERTDFKSLLSLIPVVYMQDFESITTTGSLNLEGDIKGTFNESQMPNASINVMVNNDMFRYPDLPRSVDNINIAVNAFYDGVVFDNTTLDVAPFSFSMAGNPFNAELHVKTPESDMEVAARFAGRIDLDSVSDIVPLDDIILKGLLVCDLALAGHMSTLENERYEDFYAQGMIDLSGFDFESPDFPMAVKIINTRLDFTPRRVNLANFDAIAGNTDLSLSGALENFIPFVFNGDTVRGNLELRSNNIDLNEFLVSDSPQEPVTQAETPEDTAPLSVIEVPDNIDFTMNVNISRILFDKLEITNTLGRLLIRDGIVQMQNLGMNLLDGSMVLNGEYNTQNISIPSIDFDMDIRQFDIQTALSSFDILETILPNPQNYTGRVSANMTLHSVLGEDFSPELNSINSRGRLQTQNLQIQNSPIFGAMADLLRNESWRTPTPGNLDIGFVIRDGRLIIEPVHMNIAQSRFTLSGEQGLDSSLDYRVNVAVPVSTIGAAATDVLGRIPGGSNIREITVTGLVGGTAASPNVRLDMADMAGTVVSAVTEQITERVDAVRDQAREEVNRQIDAILAEAERQAETIRSTARQSADRLRSEANALADRTISEAASRSVVERRLAQTAADRIRREGEEAALRVEREADNQANAIMDAARRRADELRQ